jgi:hypothetical protein
MSGFHPRAPLDWARTQNNLGNAQALLNERLEHKWDITALIENQPRAGCAL